MIRLTYEFATEAALRAFLENKPQPAALVVTEDTPKVSLATTQPAPPTTVTTAPQADTVSESAADTVGDVTYEMLVAEMRNYVATPGRSAKMFTEEILTKNGITRLRDAKPEQYAALHAAITVPSQTSLVRVVAV